MDKKRSLALDMLEQKLIESRDSHQSYIDAAQLKLDAIEALRESDDRLEMDVAPENFRAAIEHVQDIAERVTNEIDQNSAAHRILDATGPHLEYLRAVRGQTTPRRRVRR